jgi:translation initiation factor IF-2
MAKIRVYDLAKEIGVSNKELLGLLETIGVTGKVPSSSIEETAAQALRQMIENKNNPKSEANEEESAKAEQPTSFGEFDPSEFRAQHRNEEVDEAPVASDRLEDFRDADLTAAPEVDMAVQSAPKPKLSVAQRRPFGPARRGSPRGRGKDFREERGRRSPQDEMSAPVKKEDEVPPEGTTIAISPQITVGELAAKLKKSPAELIKKLFSMSIIRAANQPLEADVASAVAAQFGYSVEVEKSRAEIELEEAQGEMVTVPP